MVAALVSRLGRHDAAAVLGVPMLTLNGWRDRLKSPSMPARRAIWLVWCLTLHPERLTSLFDVITWGRFRVERRAVWRSCSEWSDWSV
jgi:hypothetical protein